LSVCWIYWLVLVVWGRCLGWFGLGVAIVLIGRKFYVACVVY
jgi:hypothetical protein